MSDTLSIRLAVPADAQPLRDLMEHTYRAAYTHLSDPVDLELHISSAFTLAQQSQELADPRITTLLLESRDLLTGFAQLRDDPPPPCVVGTRPLQLWRIYLHASLHGSGSAALLMLALKNHARELNAATLWLGVWELNPRAMRFYRKHGFKVVGEHDCCFGRTPAVDLVMQCSL